MPRYSKAEKEAVAQKLLQEGQRLFAAHGLKKVTIDDLAEASGMAKATFYTFYENKEYLFLDIVQGIQQKIFADVTILLENNVRLPARERVKQVFATMAGLATHYPVLSQINSQTLELLARRVSGERLAEYTRQNVDAARSLHEHGITFTCSVETASFTFQALYQSWLFLCENSGGRQDEVMELMLDGILHRLLP